jgi:hypothetical protein
LAAGTARYCLRRTHYWPADAPPRPQPVVVGIVDFTKLRAWEWRVSDADAETWRTPTAPSIYLDSDVHDGVFWCTQQRPGGRWVRKRTAAPAEDGPPGDPHGRLETLLGATAGDLRGTLDLGGVATTRYRATIDLDLAVERAPVNAKWRIAGFVASSVVAPEIEVDVAVDEVGRVRQLGFHQLEVPRLPRRFRVKRDEVIEFFDFGLPVELDVPARVHVALAFEALSLPQRMRRRRET